MSAYQGSNPTIHCPSFFRRSNPGYYSNFARQYADTTIGLVLYFPKMASNANTPANIWHNITEAHTI
jgi:hypothetical protein